MRQGEITRAARRTVGAFAGTLPVVLGVLGLTSLATAALPPARIAAALPMEGTLGPLFGAAVGSVAAGHPLTSYVLAGELSVAGVGVATVTALVVSWVTVGVVHLPAEVAILGARFALWRNAISFMLAIAMAYALAALMPAGW